MAFPTALRQTLSDMHDEGLTKLGETVTREVTLGANTFRLKMIVFGDGNISLRSRRLG